MSDVYIRVRRPEGYEDCHEQIVVDDLIDHLPESWASQCSYATDRVAVLAVRVAELKAEVERLSLDLARVREERDCLRRLESKGQQR